MPFPAGRTVLESGMTIAKAPGVNSLGSSVYRVGAGHYEFVTTGDG
jgi:hypothetical protein